MKKQFFLLLLIHISLMVCNEKMSEPTVAQTLSEIKVYLTERSRSKIHKAPNRYYETTNFLEKQTGKKIYDVTLKDVYADKQIEAVLILQGKLSSAYDDKSTESEVIREQLRNQISAIEHLWRLQRNAKLVDLRPTIKALTLEKSLSELTLLDVQQSNNLEKLLLLDSELMRLKSIERYNCSYWFFPNASCLSVRDEIVDQQKKINDFLSNDRVYSLCREIIRHGK